MLQFGYILNKLALGETGSARVCVVEVRTIPAGKIQSRASGTAGLAHRRTVQLSIGDAVPEFGTWSSTYIHVTGELEFGLSYALGLMLGV